jgi:Type I phosphodiesterase / nucleotide pyrophosphatase
MSRRDVLITSAVAMACAIGVGLLAGHLDRLDREERLDPVPLERTIRRLRRPTTVPDSQPIRVRDALADRVLIVCVDGLRPDVLLLADAPHLRGLLRSGSYTLWARAVAEPAEPAPHVSMLTGVSPEPRRWGSVTFAETREAAPLRWPTLFDLAHRAGYTTALVGGRAAFGPVVAAASLDDSLNWTVDPGEAASDADVGRAAAGLLREHRPQVMVVDLPGVGRAGRSTSAGWGSPGQVAAVTRADAAVGEVLATLEDAGLANSTVVLVTSDHGGAGTTSERDDPRARTVPWIAAGPGIGRGTDLTQYPTLSVNAAEDTFATACRVLGIPLDLEIDGRFVEQILVSFQERAATQPATTQTSPTQGRRPPAAPGRVPVERQVD